MDAKPFLEINLLKLKDWQIEELKKFHKTQFNIDKIIENASILKYSNEIKNIFTQQLRNSCDESVKFFLSFTYDKSKTKKVIENFRLILKKALNSYINELMNEKIKSALEDESSKLSESSKKIDVKIKEKNQPLKVFTTKEELEAYVVVKTLLSDVVSIKDITYKNITQYFAITYKNKSTCWICRFYLNNPNKKYVCLNLPESGENRFNLKTIYDIRKIRSNCL